MAKITQKHIRKVIIVTVSILFLFVSGCATSPTTIVSATPTPTLAAISQNQPTSVILSTETTAPSPEPSLPTQTNLQTPTLNSSQSPTPFTATFSPDPGLTPTAAITEIPFLSPKKITETVDLKVLLDKDKSIVQHPLMGIDVVLDDSYLYWEAGPAIYRTPLEKFSKEVVATSIYPSLGDLSRMRPIRSGDWLIFLDTQDPDQNNFSTWTLRAINLKDHSEVDVDARLNQQSSFTGPWYSIDNNLVVVTEVNHSATLNCDESILFEFDLKTKVKHTLDHGCIENNYMLVFPQLSNNYLVVEQDVSNIKGVDSNLFLYDLNTGERKILSGDGHSSMPQFKYPWIIWKESKRYVFMSSIGVYNIENGQSWSIPVDGGYWTDPQLSGHLAFWKGTRTDITPSPHFTTFFIYDLDSYKFYAMNAPGEENQDFVSIDIYESTIAWLLDLDSTLGKPDGVIEWGNFQLPGS